MVTAYSETFRPNCKPKNYSAVWNL